MSFSISKATVVILCVCLGVGLSEAKVLAESFVVNGNKALNTNKDFRKIDGHPRMSIWGFSSTDPDQQFDRRSHANGGTMLVHRSTGKCINIHYLSNGSEFNVYPCNSKDPDQSLNIIDLGGGFVQLQRRGTNQCIDAPNRTDGGKVHMWTCDRNNPNQRWKNYNPQPASTWRLPWGVGIRALVTQRWHDDGWNKNKNALDIGLSAGTAVFAPTDSKVVNFCNAGNNHLAIQLQSSTGQMYSLIHVTSTSVSKGKTFKKGDQIGRVAGDRPWNSCAKSTGSHLHFGLPSQNFSIDGYNFTSSNIPSPLIPRSN